MAANNTEPIAAIDVSKWQGRIDWAKVKAENPQIKIVAIKAGGGDDGIYPDNQFRRNWIEAKRVGFERFAYWFASPAQPAQFQFDFFSEQLGGDMGEYRPCIDVEAPTRAPSPTHLMSMMVMFELWVKQFGYYPALYSANWWWSKTYPYATSEFKRVWAERWAEMPLWVASYTDRPILFEPFTKAAMWQYTDKGKVSGIGGVVDMNWVFDADALRIPNLPKPPAVEGAGAVAWPEPPFDGKTVGTVIARANRIIESRELWRTVSGVDITVVERADGYVKARIKNLEAWLPEGQVQIASQGEIPPTPTPTLPAPQVEVKLGYNCLNGGMAMARAEAGCRFFMLMDLGVARQIKRRYPDAVVMVRWYHKDKRIEPIDAIRALSPSLDDELVFTLFNENEAYPYHTAEDIRIRAEKDIQFAEMIRVRSPKSICALGGFSSGEPFIDNDTNPRSLELREAFKRYYSIGYNQGQYGMNFHTYTPTLTDEMNQYHASRWRFLFSHCGFDVKSKSRIYSGETGVDTGLVPNGANGFSGIGATQAQVREWCTRYKQVQAQPVNGQPSPFVGGAVFQLGGNNDARWDKFEVKQYVIG